MPSFDTVSEANMVEVKNAIDQANKEITNRFDFKGTDARIDQKERELSAFADSDFQLEQLREVMLNKLTKRGVDVRFLDNGKIEKIGGDKVKQVIKIKNGIETEDAKKIVRVIKDSKLKVQATIQGDAVRVTGAKRDDLQAAMAAIGAGHARTGREVADGTAPVAHHRISRSLVTNSSMSAVAQVSVAATSSRLASAGSSG